MNKLLLLFFAATAVAWADFEWPTQQMPVRIDGQLVHTVWRDGRPFVDREEVLPVLHIRSGPDQLDLAEALAARGYTIQLLRDTCIDCRKPVTAGGPSRGPAPSAAQHRREWQNQQRLQARAPRLVASGYRYVAETDFIRAYCVVQNCGGGPSPACSAIGEFTDWYGRPFAQDSRPLPPLNPGESVEMTFFSLVHKDETQPNGVIKADKYTCQVRFVGPGLAENGTPARRNPTRAYRPSASVKRRVNSTDFHIDSSTTRFTPGNSNLPTGTSPDNNGFPRAQP